MAYSTTLLRSRSQIATLNCLISVKFGGGRRGLQAGGHDVGGGAAGFQLVGHEVHVGGHVREVAAVALAEVVQAGLAVGGDGEAVFRAFAVAGEEVAAVTALPGKCGVLVGTEALLPLAEHHLDQRMRADVAELIFRKHEVVA